MEYEPSTRNVHGIRERTEGIAYQTNIHGNSLRALRIILYINIIIIEQFILVLCHSHMHTHTHTHTQSTVCVWKNMKMIRADGAHNQHTILGPILAKCLYECVYVWPNADSVNHRVGSKSWPTLATASHGTPRHFLATARRSACTNCCYLFHGVAYRLQ